MTERWAHDFEVRVTRQIEVVYVVNAKDAPMAEEKARSWDASGLGTGCWSKRSEEITAEEIT